MSAPATRWEDVYATQTARITELERENAALRGDKEILDWLDANVDAIMLKLQPNSLRLDVREMVRKARKEGQP